MICCALNRFRTPLGTHVDGVSLLVYAELFDNFILPRFAPGWIRHLIFADGYLCCVLALRHLQVRYQLPALLFEVRWILLLEVLQVTA